LFVDLVVGFKDDSYEGDHGEVPFKNEMEDVEWVYERSRWICKADSCLTSYAIKWLFH
jgi:hypothetical protein